MRACGLVRIRKVRMLKRKWGPRRGNRVEGCWAEFDEVAPGDQTLASRRGSRYGAKRSSRCGVDGNHDAGRPFLANPERRKLINPPNVGKSTLLAAISLPHDMGNDGIRRHETLLVRINLRTRTAGEMSDVFREWSRRQIPTNLVWAAIGGGLETSQAATYHLLGNHTGEGARGYKRCERL
jgi:hypothetical protein